jgi:hypothetical protein
MVPLKRKNRRPPGRVRTAQALQRNRGTKRGLERDAWSLGVEKRTPKGAERLIRNSSRLVLELRPWLFRPIG